MIRRRLQPAAGGCRAPLPVPLRTELFITYMIEKKGFATGVRAGMAAIPQLWRALHGACITAQAACSARPCKPSRRRSAKPLIFMYYMR